MSMNVRPKFKMATELPTIEGDLIFFNHYNAIIHITPSAIRNLQSKCKNPSIEWKDKSSHIAPFELDGYCEEYAIRCEINVLAQIVKLARLGYDVDLRPYSGKSAQPLDNIDVFIQNIPEDEQKDVIAYLYKKPLGHNRKPS